MLESPSEHPDVAIIGAAGGGTVLKPDNTTHTLHFGGVGLPGTVRINTVITDFSAVATNLSVAFPSAVTLLKANTYTGITTVNGSILVSNGGSGLGTGSGTDADGTIVNPGGQLSTSAGITIANEKITVTKRHSRGFYDRPGRRQWHREIISLALTPAP